MTNKRKRTYSGPALWAGSAILFPFVTSSAGALVTIGDHTNLYFNGSAAVRYDDNIFLEHQNEESDVVFILSPGLELNVGARENANVNLYFREDFYLYQDNSELDSENSNVFLESYWNQARLDLRFNASFQELTQVTPDLVRLGLGGALIERDLFDANVRGEYEISERTSASLGATFSRLEFDTRGFSDRDIISIPVNFYYEATPQVDLSVGYRYRETDNDSRASYVFAPPPSNNVTFGPDIEIADFTDHYFNVGARGELAPKLVGEARAGYQIREFEGGSDTDLVSFGVDLSHYTTPSTTLLVGAFRDFETGGLGESVESTGGSLGARHAFSHLLAGHAGVNYYERNYGNGREDDTLDLNVGLSYSPIVYLDFAANYIYRTNDSSVEQFEFTNNVFSISAALRY